MSDPNNKLMPPKKVVPNSLRLKCRGQNSAANTVTQKNMATILNRLPFVHQMTKSQRSVMAISPLWQKWCSEQLPSTSPNTGVGNVLQNTQLQNIDDQGELSILCKTNATATLIKHQQQSLLTFLNDSGFDQIRKVKIQSSPKDNLNNPEQTSSINGYDSVEITNKTSTKHTNSLAKNNNNQTRPEIGAKALQALECVQSAVDNEQLSAALQRLSKTLSQNSKKS